MRRADSMTACNLIGTTGFVAALLMTIGGAAAYDRLLPAVSKDAAQAAPRARPWFETRGRCPRSSP
jgi:hypothetical protein